MAPASGMKKKMGEGMLVLTCNCHVGDSDPCFSWKKGAGKGNTAQLE
jgi:hypothetical protein